MSDAVGGPPEFPSTAETLDTVASNVFRQGKKVTLGGDAFCKAATIIRSAPESARDHSILLSLSVVRGGLVFSCPQAGPALADIDPLRQGLRVIGLLNGLAALTSIRLSSLSAGPDAMRIDVVFTGTGTVPILAKSIGRDRPQNRVRKSTGVCCPSWRALATAEKGTRTEESSWYEAM